MSLKKYLDRNKTSLVLTNVERQQGASKRQQKQKQTNTRTESDSRSCSNHTLRFIRMLSLLRSSRGVDICRGNVEERKQIHRSVYECCSWLRIVISMQSFEFMKISESKTKYGNLPQELPIVEQK